MEALEDRFGQSGRVDRIRRRGGDDGEPALRDALRLESGAPPPLLLARGFLDPHEHPLRQVRLIEGLREHRAIDPRGLLDALQ